MYVQFAAFNARLRRGGRVSWEKQRGSFEPVVIEISVARLEGFRGELPVGTTECV